MARTTPYVVDETLVIESGDGRRTIAVGSDAWFAWLDGAMSFAFNSAAGTFIARRERASSRRGGWYWRAYRRRGGELKRAYLGKAAELTLERLRAMASGLASSGAPDQALSHPETEADPPIGNAIETRALPARSDPRPGASVPEISLLATKLYIPQAHSTLVARPRLLERLAAGVAGKLTLVAAPAGFGKTTLLAQGLEVGGWGCHAPTPNPQPPTPNSYRVAWLSLDPADNDPTLFLRYLIAALQTIAPQIGATALGLLRLPQLPPLDALMTALLNDIIQLAEQSLLVLDDYHVISTPAIHQALTFLLDQLPPRLHLVIATREDPPLPLARLRARGQLAELRATDLRFTSDEASSFLSGSSTARLGAEVIAALERRTEGWIAGLQLAALALRDRPDPGEFVEAFAGSNRYVVDYLLEEVVRQQPPHIQTFLLQTAILDRLCGPLCDAVLGVGSWELGVGKNNPTPNTQLLAPNTQAYSKLILGELDQRNLFLISLDDTRQWYRYHHLFAEVMRARLASGASRAELAALHRRASEWFERHDLIVEAVQHALAGGDVERAAGLIEQSGLPLAARGQAQTVLGWLAVLPEAFVRTRASLCIVYAASLVIDNQPQAIEPYVQSAEARAGDMSPAQARVILGQVCALRAVCRRIFGDLEGAITLAQQALELLPDSELFWRAPVAINISRAYLVSGDVTSLVEHRLVAMIEPARASGNPFAYLAAIFGLGRLQTIQGRLRAAAATYREALQALPQAAALRHFARNVIYYFGLGDLLREWNDLDAAEQHLEQGMDLIGRMRSHEAEFVLLGYLAMARLKQARGDLDGALQTVAAFLGLARQRGLAQLLIARGVALQARLALAQGDRAAAAAWASANAPDLSGDLRYLREVEHLTLARIWIALGCDDPSARYLYNSLSLLEPLLAAAEAHERFSSVIEIRALQARALWAQGQHDQARSALSRALTLAAPEGYVRIFVDEGPPMAELLREARRADIAPGYVATLLAAFPRTESSGLRTEFQEPLTPREVEVLRLLAVGASNGAIAEALVISVGTAKKHVNNILAKLAVSSRTQAAIWARERGLLT
jgi:LuxR family maltose regulon positive regulatory protein